MKHQIHVYKDTLQYNEILEKLYGLSQARSIKLIVVIGQINNLPEHRRRVLEQINLSLHNVEIIPFDLLSERAEMFLQNIEKYLEVKEV